MPENKNNMDDMSIRSNILPLVIGVFTTLIGIIMAVVFLVEFNAILSHDLSNDMRAAVRSLQLTTVALWLAGAFWGAYLIRDSIERAQTERRLREQAETLRNIEIALQKGDEEREEVNRRSHSFWNWRRAERTERDGYE